jgi:hypothetical protein
VSRQRSPEGQAEWDAARERVRRYHEQELAKLIERLRAALASLDAGEIDVFEFDQTVHQYKKATRSSGASAVEAPATSSTLLGSSSTRTLQAKRETGGGSQLLPHAEALVHEGLLHSRTAQTHLHSRA